MSLSVDALHAAFANPGAAWRGKPFWAWNGRLDKEELLRQVHVMHRMGLGGFFMHSRVGLATEYLGDTWFDCIRACAEEGERLGMEAWLYDEDRWPSGTAGGMVTEDPRHRMRHLRLVIDEPPPPGTEAVLARFACDGEGLDYATAIHLAEDEAAPPGFRVLQFCIEPMAESGFYNGQTYVDTMSRAATDAFLESTHELYARRCGDLLGRSIKGIFTDEPHRGPMMTTFGQGVGNSPWLVPWTPDLPDAWRDAWGDELIPHLPELFLRPGGARIHPVKWRYVELCLRLFIDRFCRPVDDWCRHHGVVLTGHFLHEDSLSAQVAMNGSMIRCHATMELPGMDLLTEGNRAFWVAKQLQSAGRQFSKPWLLSELYGCTGWQMPLSGHKHVGDWQALHGVNVRCHHLSWATMEGEAKRDYPASILHQSAWWTDYAAVEGYFARLGRVLSEGEPACDTLVVHPVESVWAQVHPGWCDGLSAADPAVRRLEDVFAETFHALCAAGIDFDYGDEGVLAAAGDIDGASLRVGAMRYRRVLVSGCDTVRSTTVALLERFAAAGGEVVFAGPRPTHVDAIPERMAGFGQDVPDMAAAIARFAREHPLSIRGSSTVHAQMRLLGSDRLVALLNVDRDHAATGAIVEVRGTFADAERWDPLTGERHRMAMEPCERGVRFAPDLGPGGEAIVVLRHDPSPAPPMESAPGGEFVPVSGPFPYRLDEPNALVLDTCDVVVDGVSLGSMEILRADRAVRKHFGLPHRGGEMVQPWYAAMHHGPATVLGRLALEFAFDMEWVPADGCLLAIERPDRCEVRVNGASLGGEIDRGWWVDTALRTLRIPEGALRIGRNVVRVECDFRRDHDLEAMFLLGDFGVDATARPPRTTRLPATLAVGDLCGQGLPFYTGVVSYEVPLPPGTRELDLPDVAGACVRFDGRGVPWAPFRAKVEGDRCVVDVVATRRNAFGPLHLVPKRQGAYGPDHWTTAGAAWSDDYQLFPTGLMAPPRARKT